MKYRIKTHPDVVVDAHQIVDARKPTIADWPDWLRQARAERRVFIASGRRGGFTIKLGDGPYVARSGMWVIRDPKGVLSINDNEGFQAAYELAEPAAPSPGMAPSP